MLFFIIRILCIVHLSCSTTSPAPSTTTGKDEPQTWRNDSTNVSKNTEDIDMSNLGLAVLSKSMFTKFDVLNVLNLSSNNLTSMRNVGKSLGNVKLFVLNLSHNNLGFFHDQDRQFFDMETGNWKHGKYFLFDFKYLWSLDLSHNFIREIAINFRVTKLNLSNNLIRCHNDIDARGSSVYVGDLNLSHNFIECQSEIFTFTISTLDMSYNKLESIDANGLLRGLTSLTKLNLSHNNIRYIDPWAFQDTVRLQHLNLQSNKIRRIYKQVWSPLAFIKYIDLSSNQLDYLEWDTDFVHKPPTEIIVNVENNTNSRWSSDSTCFKFCKGYIYSGDSRILACITFRDNMREEYLLANTIRQILKQD